VGNKSVKFSGTMLAAGKRFVREFLKRLLNPIAI
jgi:hypothetical protein